MKVLCHQSTIQLSIRLSQTTQFQEVMASMMTHLLSKMVQISTSKPRDATMSLRTELRKSSSQLIYRKESLMIKLRTSPQMRWITSRSDILFLQLEPQWTSSQLKTWHHMPLPAISWLISNLITQNFTESTLRQAVLTASSTTDTPMELHSIQTTLQPGQPIILLLKLLNKTWTIWEWEPPSMALATLRQLVFAVLSSRCRRHKDNTSVLAVGISMWTTRQEASSPQPPE